MPSKLKASRLASGPRFRKTMSSRIATRWEEVWNLLPHALEGDDPEAVHAARVASRRLRAAMDSAAEAYPKPWYRALHKSAKSITRTLGYVRDRDVLLATLAGDREQADESEHAGIDHLIERVQAERDEARSAMQATLSRSRIRPIRKESRLRFPIGGGKKARRVDAAALPKRARRQIEQRTADVLGYESIIPKADAVEELHDARIAVKRLRYTIELFEDQIGEDGAKLTEETKGLQDTLGHLHDLDVQIQFVDSEIDLQREASTVGNPGLIPSLEAIRKRDEVSRQEVHRAVVSRWDAVMGDGFRERLGRVADPR